MSQWRDSLERALLKGAAIEQACRRLGLNEDHFSVYTFGQATWNKYGGDKQEGEANALPDFRRMVEEVTRVLGQPDKVEAQVDTFGGDPTLLASWEVEMTEEEATMEGCGRSSFTVTVSIMSPDGCPLDPRTPKPKRVKLEPGPQLHPECLHVIEEIEANLPDKWEKPCV